MVDRLFQMVYLLMEKPQMTAKELAEKFEVSERTIYRDIDKLSLAGIPIYANQGKNGGISLLSDYVLDKAVLSAEEKLKIYESLNAFNEVDLAKKQKHNSKLNSFFGEQYQDWIEIEFSSWGNPKADAEAFAKLKGAILNHQYVQIVYSGNRGGSIERKIKPLKLCFKDQAWYLYAYCCLRKDYRFFKLRRISMQTVLEEEFEPEVVGKVFTVPCEENGEEVHMIPVTVVIDSQMAYRVYDELSNITVLENGDLQCVIEVTVMDWFLSFVLSYGPYLRVIEPVEIKEKVKDTINKMNQLYE